MNHQFKPVLPREYRDCFHKRIGDEWILLSARDDAGRENAMTASWGGIGVIWNTDICFCLIRPQRYTYQLTEKSDYIGFNFFGGGMKKALDYCGVKSGRDTDKIADCSLTPVRSEKGMYFAESELVLLGKKIYTGMLEESGFIGKDTIGKFYKEKDFHKVYVCKIEEMLVKEPC